MTSHRIAPIPEVADYFARHHRTDTIPLVWETFRPNGDGGLGWYREPYRKRVSEAHLRKLADAGVQRVGLSHDDGRTVADFTVRELLASAVAARGVRRLVADGPCPDCGRRGSHGRMCPTAGLPRYAR